MYAVERQNGLTLVVSGLGLLDDQRNVGLLLIRQAQREHKRHRVALREVGRYRGLIVAADALLGKLDGVAYAVLDTHEQPVVAAHYLAELRVKPALFIAVGGAYLRGSFARVGTVGELLLEELQRQAADVVYYYVVEVRKELLRKIEEELARRARSTPPAAEAG